MRKSIFIASVSIALVAVVALAPSNAAAQPPVPPPSGARGPGMQGGGPQGGPGGGGGHGIERALMKHLYPLEMVRRFADEIELTDDQIKKLRKVVTDVNAEVEQLKWDLTSSSRKLVKMVEQGASKDAVYKQMDVIFKYENKLKKKHLGLMIVIRDTLTKKQRKKLDEVKEKHMGKGRGGPGKGFKGKDPFSGR